MIEAVAKDFMRETIRKPDPTRLEIFKNIFHSIAEEMGAVLRRSAFSPNIKERRDYSCAVYDANGEVLAMGDHMPVHLGSMPASVAAARSALTLETGDIAVLNDPFAGGTHLPDLTMVMPVHLKNKKQPSFYIANRAHHADIGGALAGSMGPAREIFEEGLRIPPVHLFHRGELNRDAMSIILANVRTPDEREGDLAAQVAACRTGHRRLLEVSKKYGERELHTYGSLLLEYSQKMMSSALCALRPGKYAAEDFLDDDGVSPDPLKIKVRIKINRDRAEVDFSGSAPQCAGNVNAVEAIAVSAVYYVFRCLLTEDVPATSGLIRPIRVIAPAGTVVNAELPAAVAGGNVETSQRMVDTLFRALAKAAPSRIPAASQGTMNNFTLGGCHPGNNNAPFAYYETIAGGMGARPGLDGISAVHTHMTNSWNTPIEVFEQTCPVRVRSYSIRQNSGGAGKFRGGDGIIREIELLTPTQVGILSDRRERGPFGLNGGLEGKRGRNELVRKGKATPLPGKCAFNAEAGDIVRIQTPGGGGWGKINGRRPGKKKVAVPQRVASKAK
ncbi:MAG TPA: hydantoinase B/oxoprolinase family protein [Candidatus Acidoferrum sp.]|jgi:N-methylhydantoinase B|nr:hydantoinase B/oxoprolinase family protein [Candidatus Acidoferrum sp.]